MWEFLKPLTLKPNPFSDCARLKPVWFGFTGLPTLRACKGEGQPEIEPEIPRPGDGQRTIGNGRQDNQKEERQDNGADLSVRDSKGAGQNLDENGQHQRKADDAPVKER